MENEKTPQEQLYEKWHNLVVSLAEGDYFEVNSDYPIAPIVYRYSEKLVFLQGTYRDKLIRTATVKENCPYTSFKIAMPVKDIDQFIQQCKKLKLK